MFWYVVLNVFMVLFALVALAAFVIFLISGCDAPEVLLAVFIAGLIAAGCCYGATSIEKANTITYTNVAEMEVTKCDMVCVTSNNATPKLHYYVTVDNEHIVEVTSEEYAKLNIGDTVSVEIETKTTFGNTTEKASLN